MRYNVYLQTVLGNICHDENFMEEHLATDYYNVLVESIIKGYNEEVHFIDRCTLEHLIYKGE